MWESDQSTFSGIVVWLQGAMWYEFIIRNAQDPSMDGMAVDAASRKVIVFGVSVYNNDGAEFGYS
jgi:hypothetical protein